MKIRNVINAVACNLHKSELGKLFLYINDIKVAMQVILPASFLFLHCDTPTTSLVQYSFCYKSEHHTTSAMMSKRTFA